MLLSLAALILTVPADDWARPPPLAELGVWSTDLIDRDGLSRFHFVTRATFSDGESPFSGASAWAYEARVHVRLLQGVALSAVVPVGLVLGHGDNRLLFGNVAAGVTVGGKIADAGDFRLRIGGGFDTYAPTSSGDPEAAAELGLVASLRSYETQLFIPQTLSFRFRAFVEASQDRFTFSAEAGLVPAISLARREQGVTTLFAGAIRANMAVSAFFEPYIEVGGSTALGGVGDVHPPLMFTPGARFHIADVFDPAVFVTFNFVAGSAIMFGVDLASVTRPMHQKRDRMRIRPEDSPSLDF